MYIFCKECFTGILNEYILPNSKKISNVDNNNRLFTTSIAVGILRENYFKHNNSKHANQVFVHINSSKIQIFWSRFGDRVWSVVEGIQEIFASYKQYYFWILDMLFWFEISTINSDINLHMYIENNFRIYPH